MSLNVACPMAKNNHRSSAADTKSWGESKQKSQNAMPAMSLVATVLRDES
jgi:hypothetical protein